MYVSTRTKMYVTIVIFIITVIFFSVRFNFFVCIVFCFLLLSHARFLNLKYEMLWCVFII